MAAKAAARPALRSNLLANSQRGMQGELAPGLSL